ncbi:epidermis-specific secreted glycoprotein EP1-like [Cornus florida]|uniref:epidermis-specific secreted glycoprotein EP1-like n=1 Tax=Cornus florida TaxID=4283 RepID=UPI00289839B4|nr:epidermis-specific secreted glycoprotein EP1-like [Cornus florida]
MSCWKPLFSVFLLIFFSISQASVPPSKQFKYVNEGELGDNGDYGTEYGGNYRNLSSIFNSPFQLCFFNTTPNAFTLALRMGTLRSYSVLRWVWEANRANPVREKATLTFGSDGNLVLADANGRIAWQTGTANKGVVGLKLLPNGNMVLHDSRDKFIWQSFDYPTDTLLVGQSLTSRGPTKLVSRASAAGNSNGPYSLVLEPKWVAMYYKSINSPTPMVYFTTLKLFSLTSHSFAYVKFSCVPDYGDTYFLQFDFKVSDGGLGSSNWARPNYNATLSFVRLEMDGNLKFYTYNAKVDNRAWEVTSTLFDKHSIIESECQLPERCGRFGLCADNQCFACPKPNGLVGWTKDCEPEKVTSCGVNDFYYYKIVGVDHFMSTKYTKGDGPMKENDCSNKCTKDCMCLGFFYHQDTSMCWIAYDLKTLSKVANSKHLAYIKAPKR